MSSIANIPTQSQHVFVIEDDDSEILFFVDDITSDEVCCESKIEANDAELLVLFFRTGGNSLACPKKLIAFDPIAANPTPGIVKLERGIIKSPLFLHLKRLRT